MAELGTARQGNPEPNPGPSEEATHPPIEATSTNLPLITSTATATRPIEPVTVVDLLPSASVIGSGYEQLPDEAFGPSDKSAPDDIVIGRTRTFVSSDLSFLFHCEEYKSFNDAIDAIDVSYTNYLKIVNGGYDEILDFSIGDQSRVIDVPSIINGTDYTGSYIWTQYGRFLCFISVQGRGSSPLEELERAASDAAAEWPSSEQVSASSTTSTAARDCTTNDGQRAFDALTAVHQEFMAILHVSWETARAVMPDQIEKMREVRINFARGDWPECSELARAWLTVGMDKSIDSFSAFVDMRPAEIANALYDDAERAFDTFSEQLGMMHRI